MLPPCPCPVQSLLHSAFAAWGPVSLYPWTRASVWLRAQESRCHFHLKPGQVTQDTDFTSLVCTSGHCPGLAMGSVSLEVTATLGPQTPG